MKESIFLQVAGDEVDMSAFSKEAKNMWKSEGNKVKDIKKIDLYVKPEENKCYYVINSDFKGAIDIT
ncbi:MAG TPA: hypothetical protein DCG38_03895 [Eubacteriaceae bacterium]|jgi:hypothetical protein|nr:hypothetical protein [Eubacteriaceae bacterium]